AERLALDVEAGVENCAGSVLVEPARYAARERIECGLEAADRARVLTRHQLPHAMDRGRDAGAAVLPELRPAGEPLGGADLQKRIDLPAAIDMKMLKLCNLHSPPRLRRPLPHSSAQFIRTGKRR